MKRTTTKYVLFASTLVVLFLIAENTAFGNGLLFFQKPAVNTGRNAQPAAVHYQVYIPGVDTGEISTEVLPTATPTAQPQASSLQLVSVPASNSIQAQNAKPAPTVTPVQTQTQPVQAARPTQAVQPSQASEPDHSSQPNSPALQSWIDQVKDGETGVVRGLYAEGVLALRVRQQPQNNWQYVSTDEGTATQFQSAWLDVTGLLAHNYLAGGQFYNLKIGQQIVVIFGDGKIERYQISEIRTYQKLDEDNYYSPFIDQENGEKVSSTTVFNRIYSGSKHLALQTCLEKDGDWSWGLYFVIATPIL